MTLDEIKREAVRAAIERHGGNKSAAAAELAISLKTIYNVLGEKRHKPRRTKLQRARLSTLEIVPIDPRVQAQVKRILRARGIYQNN